jgi:plasmid stabilization system protein ParE
LPTVIVAETARQDLAQLIGGRELPPSTRDRVRRSIEPLATFPRFGPALDGRWSGFRSILGAWPWMLIVYAFDEQADLVIVATIQDARSGRSPRSQR